MYIAQIDFIKIENNLLELFLVVRVYRKTDETHDYSRVFLKENAVKTICLLRRIPDSFQSGRNRSTYFFEGIN